jgi:hypothetical protein
MITSVMFDPPICRKSLRVPTEFWNWGYNCCFFLNFVPLHIESPYNFGGTGSILGVKKPLQRVNGHAAFNHNNLFVLLVEETGVPGENHQPVSILTYCCIQYTLPWRWFELTTLVVIGTDSDKVYQLPWYSWNIGESGIIKHQKINQ